MKKRIILLPLLLLLTSCSSTEYIKDKRYTISLLAADHVSILSDPILRLNKGETATFDIKIDDDYFLTSLNYGVYDDINSKITIENVNFSLSIQMTLNFKDGKNIIVYDYNGSTSINRNEKLTYKQYDTTYHKRVNTFTNMDVFPRYGYTLTGWNTKKNGSGEYIGLGSRASIKEDELTYLYAQWEKWDNASNFTYDIVNEKVFITGYYGNNKKLVVPGLIENYPVIEIMTDSFINCPNLETLILPDSMGMIQKYSFQNCPNLKTIYFFDTLKKVYDESFLDCTSLSTVHINANMKPKYCDRWTGNWADKWDRLILGKEAGVKQMAFFSGSSMSNGLWSPDIDSSFNYTYKITDLGVSYLVNAQMQFELMSNFLTKDDILVHAPEDLSEVTLEKIGEYNDITWRCVEQNYGLIALTDIRNSNDFFKSYAEFNYNRSFENDTEYTDYEDSFNEYGDLKKERENGADEDKGYEVYYDPTMLDVDVLKKLSNEYQIMMENNITVYVSFGPANLSAADISNEVQRARYEEIFKENITSAPVISNLSDYLYTGEYFSNTNYHLTTEGAKIRTAHLISDLKTQMIKDNIWTSEEN